MTIDLSIGTRVVLSSFNGTLSGQSESVDDGNFWLLIGFSGTIVENRVPKGIESDRVLVVFDTSLQEFGLPSHNKIENSLWIKQSDLQTIT